MQACECKTTKNKPESCTHSLDFSRLALAAETAQRNMRERFKDCEQFVHETKSHSFERGFCVGAVGSDGKNISLAVSSVVDMIPYDFILTWDMSFFNEDTSGSESDILWIDFDLIGPVQKNVRIPLRAVGLIRDLDTGRVASVNTFELVSPTAPMEPFPDRLNGARV
ncbi:MAG: hypothetical protein KZQ97_21630 [Candidatus Thiodiazotropha sp. (ex Dulcina madagascariensis)]|nr:hypothetical protein [Candidatus Thiodiazotropha sp. (ex Dulcina madagascariensis)]